MTDNIFNGGGVRIGTSKEGNGPNYLELKEVRNQQQTHPPYFDAPIANNNQYGNAQPYSSPFDAGVYRPQQQQQQQPQNPYQGYGQGQNFNSSYPQYSNNNNRTPVIESSLNRAQYNDDIYLQQDPHYREANIFKKFYIRYFELQPPNIKLMIVSVVVLWFIVSILIIKEF